MTSHFSALRDFFARRMSAPAEFRAKDAHLCALGDDMVAWATTVDVAAMPTSLNHAVVLAAATLIQRAFLECNPGWEVIIFPPEQTTHEGSGHWRLCWESGPNGWGVESGVIPQRLRVGDDWYTEPHFSFDLCFVPMDPS